MFSMLTLILAKQLCALRRLEGVGLCSYLVDRFLFPSQVGQRRGSPKLSSRIDRRAGFILGMFLHRLACADSLRFNTIVTAFAPGTRRNLFGNPYVTAATLLLFRRSMRGKSAQLFRLRLAADDMEGSYACLGL